VLQQGLSIAKAGRRLSLCPSTAKLIVRRFKETGTFSAGRTKEAAPPPPASEQPQSEPGAASSADQSGTISTVFYIPMAENPLSWWNNPYWSFMNGGGMLFRGPCFPFFRF
jgi:hypothetical protein